jgi:hypothetical protein
LTTVDNLLFHRLAVGSLADYESAIQHSAALPQPKERGVYAASVHEAPQPAK